MTVQPDGPGPDHLLAQVNQRLSELVPATLPGHEALDRAMRDSMLGPGKRLRPIVAVMIATELGGSAAAALDAGCAVEMAHAASLVLDDLPCMDDAVLRRGQPALHRAHGEDVALLASIGLLSEAYALLARLRDVDPRQRGECVAVLAEAVGSLGLVAGQFQDLRSPAGGRPLSEVSQTNGLKTGSLFRAAVELGAIAARADGTSRESLRRFADEIGLAFQLLDDLLDGAASPLVTGKDVGKDHNKSTIVSMIGPAQVERRIDRHFEAAHRHLDAVFGPGSRLGAVMDETFGRPARRENAERAVTARALEQEAGAR